MKLVRLDEENFIAQLLTWLHKEKIQSIMVEGGSQTLSFFIDSGNWDEARIFTSPRSFYKGINGPVFQGDLILKQQISTDTLQVFLNHKVS